MSVVHVAMATAHTETNRCVTDSVSGCRHLIWDFFFGPVVAPRGWAPLTRAARSWRGALCWAAAETRWWVDPNVFAFGVKQSTSLQVDTMLLL